MCNVCVCACVIHSINPTVFLELIGFGLLLAVTFSVAVVMSTGRAYTCDRMTKAQHLDK